MKIDQAIEQTNAVIKGDGGAVDVTEDASALRRWIVVGPEVSHLIAQYETASEIKDAYVRTAPCAHSTPYTGSTHTKKFLDRVNKLHAVMKDIGNPL